MNFVFCVQVQEEAARQQAPHGAINYQGKVAPPNVQQVMPPPLRGPLQPGPPLIPMDQWQPR
jgi:hypothetical protein